jgi:hypothetical protein
VLQHAKTSNAAVAGGSAENCRSKELQIVNLALTLECMRVAPLVRITLGSMKR